MHRFGWWARSLEGVGWDEECQEASLGFQGAVGREPESTNTSLEVEIIRRQPEVVG